MNTNPSKTKLLAALAAIVPVLAELAQLVNALVSRPPALKEGPARG